MQAFFQRIARSGRFQSFITGVIVFTGVLVGAETYPEVVARHGGILHAFDLIILAIFVAEIAIKVLAEGKQPWRYFHDGWNVFDFLIVAAAFMPLNAQYVTVLRLLRLLRVLRLVRALPKLQVLVGALLKSLPSMAYVSLLLFLLFYVYGVAGTFLFGPNDPVHFGSLQLSILSLFQVVTLEGWADLMNTQSAAYPVLAPVVFVTFILLGTMIMLNLFIGVIMNGMTEAQKESDDARRADAQGEATIAHELEELEEQLAELSGKLARLKRKAKDREANAPAEDAAADPGLLAG